MENFLKQNKVFKPVGVPTRVVKVVHTCRKCERGFVDRNELNEHLILHHREDFHTCGKCGKRFTEIGELEQHKKTHLAESKCSCIECEKRFGNKDSSYVHPAACVGKKSYKCRQCGMLFDFEGSLAYHIKKDHRPTLCQCDYCGRSYDQGYYCEKHLCKDHFQCSICQEKFTCKPTFEKHFFYNQKTYLRPAVGCWLTYKCMICTKQFTASSELERHMIVHRRYVKIAPKKWVLVLRTCIHACFICGKTFFEQGDLESHMVNHRCHQSRQPAKLVRSVIRICMLCGKSFTDCDTLENHVMRHCSKFSAKNRLEPTNISKNESEHQVAGSLMVKNKGEFKYDITRNVQASERKVITYKITRNVEAKEKNKLTYNAKNIEVRARQTSTHNITRNNEAKTKKNEFVSVISQRHGDSCMCEICGELIEIIDAKELRTAHKCEDLNVCNKCGKYFQRKKRCRNEQVRCVELDEGRKLDKGFVLEIEKGNKVFHEKESKYLCDYCGDMVETSHLEYHLCLPNGDDLKKEDSYEDEKILCDDCVQADCELEQVHRDGDGDRLYLCDHCGQLTQKCELDMHAVIHNGEIFMKNISDKCIDFRTVKSEYLCDHCGDFVKENELKEPWNISGENDQHVCDICAKHFHRKTLLRIHQMVWHRKKDFTCSECRGYFNLMDVLRLIKGHVQNSKSDSYETFHGVTLLMLQMLSHICKQCAQDVKSRQLKQHECTSIPEYFCNVCAKGFYCKNQFDMHADTYGKCSRSNSVIIDNDFCKKESLMLESDWKQPSSFESNLVGMNRRDTMEVMFRGDSVLRNSGVKEIDVGVSHFKGLCDKFEMPTEDHDLGFASVKKEEFDHDISGFEIDVDVKDEALD